jgi:predicted amidohydrolase YtcJ
MSARRRGMSRRQFLKASAAACSAATTGWGSAAAATTADLVLMNGKILTVDPQDRIAQAVAIGGDKILFVGSNQEINAWVGPTTRVIDVGGKTVSPGIVDSHIHPLYYGRQFWPGFLNIRFPTITTLPELLAAIQARTQTTPAGQWISGNQGWLFNQAAEFNKTELDGVAPLHPVYLRHGSGQYSMVNSMALSRAGIDVDGITPDPYGGKIVRDPVTHEPTGMLLHYPAENLVMLQADGYKDLSDEVLENDMRVAQDMLLAAGITSGQDVIIGSPQHLRVYKNMADRGELKMRIYALLYLHSEEQAQQMVEQLHGFRSDYATFGGWKLAIDGGVGAGTVLMYNGSLPAARNSYYYHEPEVLNRLVRLLHDTGLQVSFHIVGDKGIDQALDAVEAALSATGATDARFRIEHACFITPASLARIRDLGVVISTQPQWIPWFGDYYRAATSDGAMARMMPIKTLLDMHIPVAFGCDVPASLWHEPAWAFAGATMRRAPSGYVPAPYERIDMHEALRIHTMGSAYAAFEEDLKGSIEVGKLADLVVWSHDLYSITDPAQAAEMRALMTIVGGRVVKGDSVVYLPAIGRGH